MHHDHLAAERQKPGIEDLVNVLHPEEGTPICGRVISACLSMPSFDSDGVHYSRNVAFTGCRLVIDKSDKGGAGFASYPHVLAPKKSGQKQKSNTLRVTRPGIEAIFKKRDELQTELGCLPTLEQLASGPVLSQLLSRAPPGFMWKLSAFFEAVPQAFVPFSVSGVSGVGGVGRRERA